MERLREGVQLAVYCPTAVYAQYAGRMDEGDTVTVAPYGSEHHKQAMGLLEMDGSKHIGWLPRDLADMLFKPFKRGHLRIEAIARGRDTIVMKLFFSAKFICKGMDPEDFIGLLEAESLN